MLSAISWSIWPTTSSTLPHPGKEHTADAGLVVASWPSLSIAISSRADGRGAYMAAWVGAARGGLFVGTNAALQGALAALPVTRVGRGLITQPLHMLP